MAKGTFPRSQFFGVNYSEQTYSPDRDGFYEAQDMSDLDPFYSGIGIGPRKGRTTKHSFSDLPHSIDWFVDELNNKHLLVGVGSKVYDMGDVSATEALSLSGLTPATKSCNVSFDRFLWHVNGVDTSKKFDGTSWSRLTTTTPSAAPVVTTGVGLLTGTFEYCFMYVYENTFGGSTYTAESKASPVTGIVCSSNWVNIYTPVDPTGETTKVRVFRRSDTAVEFQLIYDGVNTGSYNDNTPDASLAGRSIVDMYEGDPDAVFQGVTSWKNRLWAWRDSTLYYSLPGKPEKFRTNESDFLPINIDPENNQGIVNCEATKNMLIVFTRNKMFGVVGESEPFQFIELESDVGCIAQRSIATCDGLLVWLAATGVYSYDGIEIKHLSKKIDVDFSGQNRALFDPVLTDLEQAVGIYVHNEGKYWLSIPPVGGGSNSKTFVLDFNINNKKGLSQWYPYSFGFKDAVTCSDNRVATISGTSYIQEISGTGDDGTRITGNYFTRYYDFDESMVSKRLTFIGLSAYADGSNIVFYTYIDGVLVDTINLVPGGAVIGTAIIGTSVIAGPTNAMRFLSYPAQCCGEIAAFKIELSSGKMHKFEVKIGQDARGQT